MIFSLLKYYSVFLFILVASQSFGGRLIDRTIVTVNDEVILESDIGRFMEKIKSKSFQELFGGIDSKVAQNRDSVLQLLVEEKIINQQVKKLELQANEQEVEGQIRSIVKRNGITVAQLEDRLKQLGTQMKDYRDGIRRQIERKNLIDREIRPSLEVTEEQLRHFYLRNSKQEDLQTEYKIAHILISKKTGALSPSDRAKTISDDLAKKPEDFERFAKEYSDDPGSSSADGELGYFSLSSLNKEFRLVVPKTPVGQLTKPIKTSLGFNIIKVLDSRTADYSSLSKEHKEAVKGQMISQEMEKKMGLWLERKKAEAHIQRFNNVPQNE